MLPFLHIVEMAALMGQAVALRTVLCTFSDDSRSQQSSVGCEPSHVMVLLKLQKGLVVSVHCVH